ncbi:MAG: hypothetical protein WD512_09300, partial [Candidatus Paceibacterota bacterium]
VVNEVGVNEVVVKGVVKEVVNEFVERDDNSEYKKNGNIILKRPGEYAYLLTWIKLLRKGMSAGWQKLLVLEDDVLLCDNFESKARKWLTCDVPTNAVAWLLGATQLPHLRGAINYNGSYFKPSKTDGSFAIGLDSEVFPFLLSEIKKMDGPLDSGPLRALYTKYNNQCYAAFPYLVIADVSDSTIRTSKNLGKVAEQLEWNLEDFSICKNRRYPKVAVTLYIKSDNPKLAIKNLVDEGNIMWSILLIFGTSTNYLNSDLAFPEYQNISLFIYPKEVKSLKMAEQISDQHWSSLQSEKFDCTLFYDVSLKLEDNVLHAISSFL